jgi:hypothetical protein
MSAVPQTIVTVRGLTVAGERVHLELTKLKIEVRSSPAARGRVREQAELQRMQDAELDMKKPARGSAPANDEGV